MKLTPLLGLLFTAVLITSCGKKAASGKAQEKSHKNEVTTSDRLIRADEELRRSVKENDVEALKTVIFENPDLSVDKRFDDGYSLLTYAIYKKFHGVRNILLEKGASTELPCKNEDYPGFTPLMLASHLGNTNTISALLEAKALINAQDVIGDTALHKAIKNGYDEAAKLLIRSGADLRIENERRETPLETAHNLGRKDISELLTGLMNIERGAPSLATFRRIILEGDIVNYRKLVTSHPETVKEYETINPLALAVEAQNEIDSFEIAQSLLLKKFSVDGPKDSETTPLIRAIVLRKINFIELFLKAKPDFKKLDKDNRPALYYAIEANDDKLVELLLNSGAQEKFGTVNREGYWISFKGCKVADAKQVELKTSEEQATNRRIQSLLRCRWTR